MAKRAPLLALAAIGILSLTLSAGCEFDINEPPARRGDPADGPTMVSIGNSLTAGFMNGGIRHVGQRASFPNLVHQRVRGVEMQLPLVADPGIGSEADMSPLFVDASGAIVREPLTMPPTEMALNLTLPRPYDNLGIPGTTTAGIMTAETSTDPYANALFDLILRNIGGVPFSGTVVEQAAILEPQLVTAWSGNNEVLGGALSGQPQDTDASAETYVWPVGEFQQFFLALLDSIEAMEPEMVVMGNVPNVTIIPYVTYRTLGVTAFNRYHMEEDYDQDGDGTIDCTVGGNILTDCNNVEYLLLTAPANSSNAGNFLRNCSADCDTIPAEFTLTGDEVEFLVDRVNAYNAIIETEVTARGWAYVDAYNELADLPSAPTAGPLNRAFPFEAVFTRTQRPFSAFTLDGVHPSEKGHAFMANKFMEALNETYGTGYEMYDLADFTNVAGFERYDGPTAIQASTDGPGAPAITDDARQALMALPKMFKARF